MINRQSSVAMYEQVVGILRNEITSRKFGISGCIGTHVALAERFGVSIITIRRAIQILEKEGLVVVKQGKGTFVRSEPLKDELDKLSALSSVISRNRLKPKVIIRNIRMISTPEYFASAVREQLGTHCMLIEREHLAEDQTVGFTKLYIPIEYGKNFSSLDVQTFSTYYLYENKLHVTLGHGIQYIRAGKASREVAAALQVDENTPVLIIERESYSADEKLIEYMEAFYEHTHYVAKVQVALTAE